MKTAVWFEKNPPKAEAGFQNGGFYSIVKSALR